MEWYYILGAISYGIFIVQFCLSFVGSDLDVDFDGDIDFSVSDLVSFKGLIHFLMGFSGTLMCIGKSSPLSIVFAIFIGVTFMVLLYSIYQFALMLKHEPKFLYGEELIGISAKVYLPYNSKDYYCILSHPGAPSELICRATREVEIGETVVISKYINNIYYIS